MPDPTPAPADQPVPPTAAEQIEILRLQLQVQEQKTNQVLAEVEKERLVRESDIARLQLAQERTTEPSSGANVGLGQLEAIYLNPLSYPEVQGLEHCPQSGPYREGQPHVLQLLGETTSRKYRESGKAFTHTLYTYNAAFSVALFLALAKEASTDLARHLVSLRRAWSEVEALAAVGTESLPDEQRAGARQRIANFADAVGDGSELGQRVAGSITGTAVVAQQLRAFLRNKATAKEDPTALALCDAVVIRTLVTPTDEDEETAEYREKLREAKLKAVQKDAADREAKARK